jgi:hypothetical protein
MVGHLSAYTANLIHRHGLTHLISGRGGGFWACSYWAGA